MSRNVILTAKDLSKTFSNASEQQHVLKNLNLDIYQGDFTVIMGNSGSGKSTLLYALSGMDRPSLGTITYTGANGTRPEEISKYSNDRLARFRRNHCGFVFQQNYLNDSMSALDNVMVSGMLTTKNRKELADRSKELLQRVEIGEKDWKKFPAQLSGGQQQRVAVVRGVINRPEILFADEPTGALNSQNTNNAERGNRILYLADGVILDEIEIGPYRGDYKDSSNPQQAEAQERHRKLKDFLADMGW